MAKKHHDQNIDQQAEDVLPAATMQDESELEQLQQELAQEKGRRLQLMADFENFRRRSEEERSKYGILANRMLVGGVLEVLDDVQMAKNDESLDLERAKSLFDTFTDKLNGILNVNGVERLDIQSGDEFDSSKMEAIATVPGEDDNKVVAVVSSAYRYSGREELLQTAKVVVSKKS